MRTDAAHPHQRHAGARAQRGVIALEFGLLLTVFLGLVFALMELAHAMYLWNTLQEVTRAAARGAAVSDFSDPAVMDRVRQRAIFRDNAGPLPFGAPVDDTYVRIDYLSVDAAGAQHVVTALPACPLQNRRNCYHNPRGASCIRLVRARLCRPGAAGDGDCGAVPYPALLPVLDPLFTGANLAVALPPAETVQVADALGLVSGAPDTCP